jgi:hypothetical protein
MPPPERGIAPALLIVVIEIDPLSFLSTERICRPRSLHSIRRDASLIAAGTWSCEFAAGAARHDRTPQLLAKKSIGTKTQCVSTRWRFALESATIEEDVK